MRAKHFFFRVNNGVEESRLACATVSGRFLWVSAHSWWLRFVVLTWIWNFLWIPRASAQYSWFRLQISRECLWYFPQSSWLRLDDEFLGYPCNPLGSGCTFLVNFQDIRAILQISWEFPGYPRNPLDDCKFLLISWGICAILLVQAANFLWIPRLSAQSFWFRF